MRSTTTVTVWACFAELTTPTRTRRRDRRHECAGASWAEPCATGARRSGRARLTAGAAAGFAAATARVFLRACCFAAALLFFAAAVVFFAVVFFSAIRRLSLSFVHHRQRAGN